MINSKTTLRLTEKTRTLSALAMVPMDLSTPCMTLTTEEEVCEGGGGTARQKWADDSSALPISLPVEAQHAMSARLGNAGRRSISTQESGPADHLEQLHILSGDALGDRVVVFLVSPLQFSEQA
eukprot:2346180-Rhodomonas_salina.4